MEKEKKTDTKPYFEPRHDFRCILRILIYCPQYLTSATNSFFLHD